MRDGTQPAPTVSATAGAKGVAVLRYCRGKGMLERHHNGSQNAGAVPWTDAGTDKPIALTEPQGCRLMAFPERAVDALCGTKADRWRIIGNAVCPPVGRAVLEELVA